MSDHAGLIFVHLFKLTLEMFYFLVIRHLYKHIHCSAFEKTLTFVALQSFNDVNVKSDLICLELIFFHIEPFMLDCLFCRVTFFGLDNQKMFDKIFAF